MQKQRAIGRARSVGRRAAPHRQKWQKDALAYVRSTLGERGFLIFHVAAKYRRHAHDFVALKKDQPRCFAVVRGSTHHVMIRPFLSAHDVFVPLTKELQRTHSCIKRGIPILPSPRGDERVWLSFIEPTMHDELRAFGYA